MPRLIASVTDKTGIVDFVRALTVLGWDAISTGGTARELRGAEVAVKEVADITGFPEMMDGRVKTLHPHVHGPILGRRWVPADMAAIKEMAKLAKRHVTPIDLTAVNLYLFEQTVAKLMRGEVKHEDVIENIDIGGPAMLRSAAKNHQDVWVVCDPADYARVLEAVKQEMESGTRNLELREELAEKAYAHTAWYDAAITAYFAKRRRQRLGIGIELPRQMLVRLELIQGVRYGENPDQTPAAWYRDLDDVAGLEAREQLAGKEMSYNNVGDAEGVFNAVSMFHDYGRPVCVIGKHRSPCAIACGDTAEQAYIRAYGADTESPFGGIIGFNVPVTLAFAKFLGDMFVEIIVAPDFDPDAEEYLKQKKARRLIKLAPYTSDGGLHFERVRGGLLVQPRASLQFPEDEWEVVTSRRPTEQEYEDLRFAFRAAAVVKSNTMVLVADEATEGVGAGQSSRVFSLQIADLRRQKMPQRSGKKPVIGADAYLPNVDNVDLAYELGVTAIIQPGGSNADPEVIDRANHYGMAMIFTKRRVFRH